MTTPLVARDDTVTQGSDILYIPNPCTFGLVVAATMSLISPGSSSTIDPDSKPGKVDPKYYGDSTIFWVSGIMLSRANPGYMHTIVMFYDFGYVYVYDYGFIKLGPGNCLAWIPRILISGSNVSPFPSLKDLSLRFEYWYCVILKF
ncbi:hypothetical protein BCIN_10g03710 [Botrytis cinerea B05.10]|uniref:Uncharacterized protein n=2 Tax=Botryotinia fuckeliana TaxID=40559 RepID=A0A384JUW4_BOTFB|nr:hypothetical protein BCIN_10g03710 [Botrytis cinerea B05.10]ATZ54363.1 hypothetical protein BCIN_10g03710 [Botrytis cinerea B05.10]CCD49608.1 hypothetical protein BofuT4_P097160.1 [Botrytis cinerea T4]